MRMILALVFVAFPSFGQSLEAKLETATRTLQRAEGFFVIEYHYDGGSVSVPLTNPTGQPHYSATITVSKVVDGKRQQIGQPFAGEYTINGCFEDDPQSLVNYALKHKDDPPVPPQPQMDSGGSINVTSGTGSTRSISIKSDMPEMSCVPSQDQVREAIKKVRDKAEWLEGRFGSKSSASDDPIDQGTTVWVVAGTMRLFADTLNDLFTCVSVK